MKAYRAKRKAKQKAVHIARVCAVFSLSSEEERRGGLVVHSLMIRTSAILRFGIGNSEMSNS